MSYGVVPASSSLHGVNGYLGGGGANGGASEVPAAAAGWGTEIDEEAAEQTALLQVKTNCEKAYT